MSILRRLRAPAPVPVATLLLAVGLVVSAVAACGGDRGPTGKPQAVVHAAPDATAATGMAEVSIDVGTVQAAGVVDLAGGRARWLVTGSGGKADAGAGNRAQLLLTGATWYTRPDGSTAPWRTLPAATDPLSLPLGLRSADPVSVLDLVRGAVRIDPFGGAEVRGRSTIRYDLDVDPQVAAAATPAGPRRDAVAAVATVADQVVRVACYVDASGKVRRLQVPLDLAAHTPVTRPDGAEVVATVDFVGFGVPLDVQPPTDVAP